jgi:hypothetical protein
MFRLFRESGSRGQVVCRTRPIGILPTYFCVREQNLTRLIEPRRVKKRECAWTKFPVSRAIPPPRAQAPVAPRIGGRWGPGGGQGLILCLSRLLATIYAVGFVKELI